MRDEEVTGPAISINISDLVSVTRIDYILIAVTFTRSGLYYCDIQKVRALLL